MMDTLEFLVMMAGKQMVFSVMIEMIVGLILQVMMDKPKTLAKMGLVILVKMEVMVVLKLQLMMDKLGTLVTTVKKRVVILLMMEAMVMLVYKQVTLVMTVKWLGFLRMVEMKMDKLGTLVMMELK